MRRIALIPARGGSKRLPRKNLAELGGQPIIVHAIGRALSSHLFDTTVVSTDDTEIADTARAAGASVHWRDPSLATDDASVVDVCAAYLRNLQEPPERFCCIYATAAFISAEDLAGAEQLMDQPPAADVVMGVSGYPIHPYKAMRTDAEGFLKPEWPAENAKKSQEYPEFVASNGTIYWARTTSFLEHPTFYQKRLKGFRIPADRAIDIDTPEDLAWARRLMTAINSTDNT